ncbi:MAG TPA: EAL domain-containing protein, partial [Polyangiales bacterium]|nr:EAL domain-containing protein [Polyangiales bacterium]
MPDMLAREGPSDMGERAEDNGRILVVDDDETVRRSVQRMLTREGYAVVEAANGDAAVEILARDRFDAVLSDISMPGLDGIALLRVVRERDPDVPVVLLTGVPELRTALSALELGAYRYLAKPVAPTELAALLAKAVILGRVARLKREAIELTGHGLGTSDLAGLEASFARAMSSIWIAYQPIVRASDRSLFGYEALLRSQEPSLPHPGAVLDAAERLKLLPELGRRVRDCAALPMADRPECTLFVNLHPHDLTDDALLSLDTPLARIADRVVLEITERVSLGKITDLKARIATLRALGFRLAVDDLGAGYAGLTSFAQLEPEIVKLDMSLVRDVQSSPTKRKIIRSMAMLCHDLGMLI